MHRMYNDHRCFCAPVCVCAHYNTRMYHTHMHAYMWPSHCLDNGLSPNRCQAIIQNKRVFPSHDDVIKWKHFPRYWPFVRGIHRSPVNSPHKGQWRGALMFSLICARIKVWVNNGEAGNLRRHRAHYGVIVMKRRSQDVVSIVPSKLSEHTDKKKFMHTNVRIWQRA